MPRYNNPRKTWHYSKEFKVKAVQLSLIEGIQVQEVASALNIHPFMLSRWRKEYREGKIVADKRKKITDIAQSRKELNRINQLEKKNARLKEENDLLKKWQRYLTEEHQNDLDSSRDSEKNSE